ncbi:MAG TPA: hypothetical protein VE077_13505 [Candidatus Methylomirabilis sp.]|nr:hypothetical protein [Candidatus Methylomirabilis sp.]
MLETRRNFLNILAGAGTLALITEATLVAQDRQQSHPPVPPPVADADDSDALPPKSATKAQLEANEKDIKKNVDKLYQLATDLKAEVEKTDSSQVLSLTLVKKADEIERLARDIKARAKG